MNTEFKKMKTEQLEKTLKMSGSVRRISRSIMEVQRKRHIYWIYWTGGFDDICKN